MTDCQHPEDRLQPISYKGFVDPDEWECMDCGAWNLHDPSEASMIDASEGLSQTIGKMFVNGAPVGHMVDFTFDELHVQPLSAYAAASQQMRQMQDVMMTFTISSAAMNDALDKLGQSIVTASAPLSVPELFKKYSA